MLEPLQLPFVQRGMVELLLLSIGAGLLGTWIVLRGLAFFSHAVGTAAFPGLVLADGLGLHVKRLAGRVFALKLDGEVDRHARAAGPLRGGDGFLLRVVHV